MSLDPHDPLDPQLVTRMSQDDQMSQLTRDWMVRSCEFRYSYNYKWMGRPIIQYPQDMVAMQEIIWSVQPDLIIETGIAHGGSLIFSAAMLELNAACGGNPEAHVLGVDIDIRSHNREAIEQHPMFRRITMLEGSSVGDEILQQVKTIAAGRKSILVCLDSNHTHEHVLAELRAYAPLVTVGSYCVVFDTIVEDLPESALAGRPWKQGDSPKSAVWEYLKETARFEIDHAIDQKLLISVSPSGYLKCIQE